MIIIIILQQFYIQEILINEPFRKELLLVLLICKQK